MLTEEALLTSGNWKTSLLPLAELPLLPAEYFLGAPRSVKETSSGDEGWEDGDWVWYPLDGLPGLGLALPVEPA